MREKVARGFIITTIALTVLSLMFLIGLLIYNIRRVFLLPDISVGATITGGVFMIGSLFIVLSLVVYSFLPFLQKKEVDQKQYFNILIIAIVFRLILYVFFSITDFRVPDELMGTLGSVHYISYVFSYRTDLLPVSVFPIASIGFIHSLVCTDIIGIGFVLLGFSLQKKDKYAPLIGSILGIVVTIVFIVVINSQIAQTNETVLIYYKVDAIFTTLLAEFAILGYILNEMFLKINKKI